MDPRRRIRIGRFHEVAALLIIGGPAYATLGAVPNTATDAVAETSSSVPLSRSGNVPVTVASLSLPAGSWVLSSQATLVSWGPSDYVRCQIRARGVQIASGTTMVGESTARGSRGASSVVAGRGLIGTVVSGTPFVAAVRCWHDNTMAAAPYVDPGAVLLAQKSGQLYGVTH